MQSQNQIFNKQIDLIFIKFPIIFPIIYGTALYTFPSYENIIITELIFWNISRNNFKLDASK